ncbi:uncharacterized protein N7473_010761 [Penicillium subrubescens]|uniref:uncharacterized protein n=1 Tax=Penicillium subrubescens TaxID=1316194 RepID=UPI00254528B0|nr:uncharacterized protein N7473_010761 [Penicillium subrubescens]KAJ5883875.1 hypothetical protein N7473_010761 [Penicillium subrubescens]
MKFVFALFFFVATVLALPQNETGNVCASKQTVVCKSQGDGGLIALGNVLPGALGQNCAAGDVYCCSYDDVQQVARQSGLVNLDVEAQCTLNRVL